jgi:predicted  nucleic acid-binding Zn-ribbon protein
LLLEAISKINDPELKASMLHKLRKMLNKKEETKDKIPKPTISLSETLERFNKLKPMKINLEDLQNEVNQVKKEIQQLKDVNTKLQDRISILELDKKFNIYIYIYCGIIFLFYFHELRSSQAFELLS